MTKTDKKVPDDRPEIDDFGVGQNADGTLNVVTPEEYAKRIALRNAEEADANS